jgi:hypothetical protein
MLRRFESYGSTLRSGGPLLAVISLALMLSACASTPVREPLARQLPSEPSFARPAIVPLPKAGESAIEVAARERQAQKRNAETIERLRRWYRGVRKSYGAKQ